MLYQPNISKCCCWLTTLPELKYVVNVGDVRRLSNSCLNLPVAADHYKQNTKCSTIKGEFTHVYKVFPSVGEYCTHTLFDGHN